MLLAGANAGWFDRVRLGLTGKGRERRIVFLGPWRFVMLGYSLFVRSQAGLTKAARHPAIDSMPS